MINVILLTGFLGAGKTTLMNNILKEYKDNRVGIIVNEFCNEGIDGKLINSEGIEMIELTNGSIFCACIKDNFVNALISLSNMDLEYVFIESSGLADPSNFASILDNIQPYCKNKYEQACTICMVDALYFIKHYQLLPALHRQIEYSDIVVINKVDLATSEEITEIRKIISNVKNGLLVRETTYAGINLHETLDNINIHKQGAKETTNNEAVRPKTIILRTDEIITTEKLEGFLKEISQFTYRIKGFFKTAEGLKAVSCVSSSISIKPWNMEENNEIVIISSTGIKIVSEVLNISKKYFVNPIEIR